MDINQTAKMTAAPIPSYDFWLVPPHISGLPWWALAVCGPAPCDTQPVSQWTV